MTQEGFELAKYPGSKVTYGINGKGSVLLGWGRGTILFEKDAETGKVVFKDPGSSKNPNVSQLLINRAKEIYAFHEDKENGQS